ncbi:hypothetical protein [Geomonas subterranea]|uniref:hypothetical protein n=1 Tax=Geomonas subterranea TaxID=2847989 RepID=UPI001CD54956|nr:hypothetical protein [Geomonas fuzhouensis]
MTVRDNAVRHAMRRREPSPPDDVISRFSKLEILGILLGRAGTSATTQLAITQQQKMLDVLDFF